MPILQTSLLFLSRPEGQKELWGKEGRAQLPFALGLGAVTALTNQ